MLRCDPTDRALLCAAAMPRGAAVWLASTDAQSTLQATDLVCADAIAGLDGAPLVGLMIFDSDLTPAVAVGLTADDERIGQLIRSALAGTSTTAIDGLGECRTATVALSVGPDSQRLLVARLGTETLMPTELLLLRGQHVARGDESERDDRERE